jgi:hypothetical protein
MTVADRRGRLLAIMWWVLNPKFCVLKSQVREKTGAPTRVKSSFIGNHSQGRTETCGSHGQANNLPPLQPIFFKYLFDICLVEAGRDWFSINIYISSEMQGVAWVTWHHISDLFQWCFSAPYRLAPWPAARLARPSIRTWSQCSKWAGIPYRKFYFSWISCRHLGPINMYFTHVSFFFLFFWWYILVSLLRSIPALLNLHFEHRVVKVMNLWSEELCLFATIRGKCNSVLNVSSLSETD